MQEHLKDEQVTLRTSVELKEATPQNAAEQFPLVAPNYEIVELIGHGGMGTVYKAINASTGSTVAIKVFNATVSKDKATLKRFEQEANALASLDDPELLIIHESGMSPDGAPYLVMEYIEGDNLAEILNNGKTDRIRAFPLFTLHLMLSASA
ncbi:MAG: protein kinase [Candidatus Melainabacteria bacterium]|nr:protein kinase [Candidatus Melainabacteria bacterium]